MTRPMPGPPEDCYCRDGNATCDDCEAYGYRYSWGLCPGCHLHNGRDLGAHKRLKDAECAAEFWRAEGDHCLASEGYDIDWFSGGLLRDEDIACDVHATWHRFATHPHALDAT